MHWLIGDLQKVQTLLIQAFPLNFENCFKIQKFEKHELNLSFFYGDMQTTATGIEPLFYYNHDGQVSFCNETYLAAKTLFEVTSTPH